MFELHENRWGYRFILGLLISIGAVILIVLLMLTPLGSGLLKKVIESEINGYIPGAEVTYLDYGINNFSLVVKKGHNEIKVYGAVFPLNAMFEGNIENLSEISHDYRGQMSVSGKIFTDKDGFIMDGMSFFADGYMNFKVKLNDNKIESLKAKGSDFDIKRLLYIVKINYPWVEGKTDIQINKKKDSLFNVLLRTDGIYTKKIKTGFKAVTNIKMKHKNNLIFDSEVNSKIGIIDLKGGLHNTKWEYKFKATNVDLLKLKPVLLYPFQKMVNLTGAYESPNDILKFKNKDFEGFENTKIELTFKMNSNEFFKYVGTSNIFKGKMSGTVKIDDKLGNFNIVSDDTKFYKNGFTERLKYLTGIDLSKEEIGKIFFKGYFDKNRVVFDMLSTNQNISLSIKKGKFVYPDKYHIVLYLRKANNIYKILLTNGTVKVLEKRNFRKTNNKILVF